MKNDSNVPELLNDKSLESVEIEVPADRLDELNKHYKEECINAKTPKDKEQAFRMYMITHTVLAADAGATEESLVRNFLLSKPGLMALLSRSDDLERVYGAFEHHIEIHSAQHLLLSIDGFVAQLKRIAQKANRALADYTGKPGYFKETK